MTRLFVVVQGIQILHCEILSLACTGEWLPQLREWPKQDRKLCPNNQLLREMVRQMILHHEDTALSL
jgi:hypothetical protein